LGVVLNQSAFLVGLHYTTATNSAILSTLIPLFTLAFATIGGKEALTPKRLIGFLSALAGVLVIQKAENFDLSNQTMIGDLLCILNCFFYGLFLVAGKRLIEAHDPFWMTALLFSAGSLGMIPISIQTWLTFQWPELSIQLIGCMAFSIFGSTLAAYLLNNWALTRVRSSSVALFIYLQPIVASIIAWIWLGEVPTLNTIVASLLIFIGMFLGVARG
jgi:drug/metabolite transporter (DMT)-like permease